MVVNILAKPGLSRTKSTYTEYEQKICWKSQEWRQCLHKKPTWHCVFAVEHCAIIVVIYHAYVSHSHKTSHNTSRLWAQCCVLVYPDEVDKKLIHCGLEY